MNTRSQLHAQYVMDASGHRKSVVLPVEEFEGLLEDLDDLAIVAERRDEPSIPHDKAMEELKRDGHLSD